jgi:biopolymer transport protein ExbD
VKHSDIAHFRQLNSLRRRFISRSRRFPPTVEPAAMVDVVLLVLLFFLISPSFVTQPGIQIRLPEVANVEGIPLRSIVVTLTAEGLVFLNDRRLNLEDLPEEFARLHERDPSLPLLLQADSSISLETQIRIYRYAQEAGIPELYLATRRTLTPDRP